MTKLDKDEIKEMLNDVITLHTEPIKIELGHIKEQVLKTNGRVNKLEEKTEALNIKDIEHFIKCPVVSRVKELEDNQTLRKGQLKMGSIIYTVCVTLLAIAVSVAAILF